MARRARLETGMSDEKPKVITVIIGVILGLAILAFIGRDWFKIVEQSAAINGWPHELLQLGVAALIAVVFVLGIARTGRSIRRRLYE
jgi:Na+/H+-dicarboxylate symporter